MQKMIDRTYCNICNELAGTGADECGGDYQGLIQRGENIILSSNSFAIVPSVGPLSRTHAMLVPFKHTNSFAELLSSELNEAVNLLNRMQEHSIKKLGVKLFFFESGAGQLTCHSGGCITHAHIHCIAESPDFFKRLSAEVSLLPVKRMDFSSADTRHGYIWFSDSDGNCYICNRPLLPSQYLRYIYAQCTNSPSIWNWRHHTNFTEVKEVVSAYKGIK